MTTSARRWSALHQGIDPATVPLLGIWLRLMWRLARPLARARVAPTAVTGIGVVLAVAAVVTARTWPVAALFAVVAAALCDGLDGAVAVVADRATPFGARADAVADRLADAAFAAVLWRCGAPWGPALVAGVLAWTVDGLRRGLPGRRARITVAERPSWATCAALGCASAASTTAAWPVFVCVGVWIALGGVGIIQVARPVEEAPA